MEFHRGQEDLSALVTGLLEKKLRRDGFLVIDHRKTFFAYQDSTAREEPLKDESQAQDIAKSLGAKAVLLGSVEDNYERVEKREPVYRYDPIPAPACCSAAPACPGQLVRDPLVGWINSCGKRHRKVLVELGGAVKTAAVTLRLKIYDTQTRALLWEGEYDAPQQGGTLSTAAERAAESLVGKIADAFMTRGL